MILDGHIHIMGNTDAKLFQQSLHQAGIDGGGVLSLPPLAFGSGYNRSFLYRLQNLLGITEAVENTYPYFWIDPLEKDAVEQVDEAVKQGISAFKIICVDDYPDNQNAMKVYRRMAHHGKPVLFHSGIIWNDKDLHIDWQLGGATE